MAMARKSYSNRGRNIEPSVMTMTFATADTVGGNYTLDLSQCASLVNRRFYRQGINWAVASIKVLAGVAGRCEVYKLPNTWVFANSWKKGMAAWLKLSRQSFEEAQSLPGRFLDFKIYLDSIHHTAGFGLNLLPIDASGNTATAGEWIPSEIVTAQPSGTPLASTEYEILGTGASYPGLGASGRNAVSLIEGYAASRALPSESDPNTPTDAADVSGTAPENWLAAMFDSGTQQTDIVITNELQYDQPPYPFEGDGTAVDTQYPGGANQLPGLEVHDLVQIVSYSGTGNIGTQMLKGGNFPCGLMRFNWTPDTPGNLVIQVNLIPGSHRGYLCEKMGDM